MIRKSFYQINLSKVIKNFTPDWFTLNMGTGIVFVVINNIHKNNSNTHKDTHTDTHTNTHTHTHKLNAI